MDKNEVVLISRCEVLFLARPVLGKLACCTQGANSGASSQSFDLGRIAAMNQGIPTLKKRPLLVLISNHFGSFGVDYNQMTVSLLRCP